MSTTDAGGASSDAHSATSSDGHRLAVSRHRRQDREKRRQRLRNAHNGSVASKLRLLWRDATRATSSTSSASDSASHRHRRRYDDTLTAAQCDRTYRQLIRNRQLSVATEDEDAETAVFMPQTPQSNVSSSPDTSASTSSSSTPSFLLLDEAEDCEDELRFAIADWHSSNHSFTTQCERVRRSARRRRIRIPLLRRSALLSVRRSGFRKLPRPPLALATYMLLTCCVSLFSIAIDSAAFLNLYLVMSAATVPFLGALIVYTRSSTLEIITNLSTASSAAAVIIIAIIICVIHIRGRMMQAHSVLAEVESSSNVIASVQNRAIHRSVDRQKRQIMWKEYLKRKTSKAHNESPTNSDRPSRQ